MLIEFLISYCNNSVFVGYRNYIVLLLRILWSLI